MFLVFAQGGLRHYSEKNNPIIIKIPTKIIAALIYEFILKFHSYCTYGLFPFVCRLIVVIRFFISQSIF